jgi:uncharacterized membrane-anchored protein YhcB (DUF1043 family)
MVWLILAAGLLVGLAVLGLVGRAVFLRLGPLQRAVQKLQRRTIEAQALQASVEQLQEQVAAMQELAVARAGRAGGLPPEQHNHRRR